MVVLLLVIAFVLAPGLVVALGVLFATAYSAAFVVALIILPVVIGICLVIRARSAGPQIGVQRTAKSKAPAQKVSPKFYSAPERELMIQNSTEVVPGLFAHPSGLYIVRGPKGGTRVYKTREAAEIACGIA
jgi:hypothetical protein